MAKVILCIFVCTVLACAYSVHIGNREPRLLGLGSLFGHPPPPVVVNHIHPVVSHPPPPVVVNHIHAVVSHPPPPVVVNHIHAVVSHPPPPVVVNHIHPVVSHPPPPVVVNHIHADDVHHVLQAGGGVHPFHPAAVPVVIHNHH